ncbi:unnamed protein product [Clonostachys rosea f. rosea IK726]|uniref:Nitroreductase domain-containing protein n=2 Tax=Bionectria ochroleuca TaxID=29856 RepID=A0A0B7JX11_BIOOC|nr:unnamed protein product [Clonostachys rosea f. rosea IK726]
MSTAKQGSTFWLSITGLLCSIFFLAGQYYAGGPTSPSTPFLDFVKARRTYYALNDALPFGKETVVEIVQDLVQDVPSAFNSQSNRVVILFDQEHGKFWDTVSRTLKNVVAEDQWESTSDRIATFKAAAGSVLFFVDEAVVQEFAANIPAYADEFPAWATESGGMLQHSAWTALEAKGLGANLQHYNLVNEEIAKIWNLPATWRLKSQLVFGGRTGEPGEKTFKPLSEKLKVFGA